MSLRFFLCVVSANVNASNILQPNAETFHEKQHGLPRMEKAVLFCNP